MKILGFRFKWQMLWPHPWHSLFKCAHILHKHASWKHGQCWRRKFSFSLHKKTIFHFPSVKNVFFFAKHQPQICCKTWEIHFLKILYHVICTNNQSVDSEKVSIYPFSIIQISADLVGKGSNLNYRCLVVCSSFLGKIIFRYTTTYFITDTPRVSQYSTPSYERSCPPLDFSLKSA